MLAHRSAERQTTKCFLSDWLSRRPTLSCSARTGCVDAPATGGRTLLRAAETCDEGQL